MRYPQEDWTKSSNIRLVFLITKKEPLTAPLGMKVSEDY